MVGDQQVNLACMLGRQTLHFCRSLSFQHQVSLQSKNCGDESPHDGFIIQDNDRFHVCTSHVVCKGDWHDLRPVSYRLIDSGQSVCPPSLSISTLLAAL